MLRFVAQIAARAAKKCPALRSPNKRTKANGDIIRFFLGMERLTRLR